MYNFLKDDIKYIFFVCEENNTYKVGKYYQDITEEWIHNVDTSIRVVKDAKYVIKNGKRYNKINKIEHKNKEVENAKWYVNLMGGTLKYLPNIREDEGIQCADYKYYPPNSNKWYYLEEKETSGKSINVFYHALENKENQAKIFLIDCTNSYFSDEEIYERINMVFVSAKNNFIDIIIVKNGNKLFGVFKRKEK